MYKLAKCNGDAIPVPQLLFSKLGAVGGSTGRREALFQVALYLVAAKSADAGQIAGALGLDAAEVREALTYWEGAGLIEQDAALKEAVPVAAPKKRKAMTTRDVVRAGQANPQLGGMLEELQRLMGAVVSESDVNIYATLYTQDGFPPDLILLAASHAVQSGSTRARYVEKVLFGWRQNGINSWDDADRYLKLLSEREAKERKLAECMGLVWDPFTLADKKKIAQWFEEYGYGFEMVEAARMVAGDKQNEVKYLAGILKNWNKKGYRAPKDVYTGEDSGNIRAMPQSGAPKDDPLAKASMEYVPMKRRREE